jgi:hypothetical protein
MSHSASAHSSVHHNNDSLKTNWPHALIPSLHTRDPQLALGLRSPTIQSLFATMMKGYWKLSNVAPSLVLSAKPTPLGKLPDCTPLTTRNPTPNDFPTILARFNEMSTEEVVAIILSATTSSSATPTTHAIGSRLTTSKRKLNQDSLYLQTQLTAIFEARYALEPLATYIALNDLLETTRLDLLQRGILQGEEDL